MEMRKLNAAAKTIQDYWVEHKIEAIARRGRLRELKEKRDKIVAAKEKDRIESELLASVGYERKYKDHYKSKKFGPGGQINVEAIKAQQEQDSTRKLLKQLKDK